MIEHKPSDTCIKEIFRRYCFRSVVPQVWSQDQQHGRELVRNAHSRAHPEPTDSETVGAAPQAGRNRPSRWLHRLPVFEHPALGKQHVTGLCQGY